MHEAKGLAAFFAPIQTFSKVCGALCVQNSPGFCFSFSVRRSRDVLIAGLGNSTLKRPCIPPASCLLGLVKGYTIQWRVLSLWRAVGKSYIFLSVSPTLLLATGNSYVMVPCWTKANAGDEYSSWHRSDVPTPLQAAVTRISPLQVSDWCQASSLGLICENVPWVVYMLRGTSETKVLWFLVLNIIS